MNNGRKSAALLAAGVLVVVAWSLWAKPQKTSSQSAPSANDQMISNYAQEMLKQGKEIFRFDTFGDEAFWGDALRLHQAIAGEKQGGVGPGVSPKTALAVGLKVDLDALPASLVDQLKAGKVNLDDPGGPHTARAARAWSPCHLAESSGRALRRRRGLSGT